MEMSRPLVLTVPGRAAMILVGLMALEPAPAFAQFGQIMRGVETAKKVDEIRFTDAEEQQLGAAVSLRIRTRYGVVQDPAVHRYVALVGRVLADAGSRPLVPFKFIVLDTDAVNAFAAPGGFVHITKGTLALVKNEAELAGVLAHEIMHVNERHTIRAIQKGKAVQIGVDEKLAGNAILLDQLADRAYEVLQAGFGRVEELEADGKGIDLANKVGYDPSGLSGFLGRLGERNKGGAEKRGLFASHPELDARLEAIRKQIAARKLAATATLQARYTEFVKYVSTPQAEIAVVESGAAGLTGGGAKPDAGKNDAAKDEAAAEEKAEPKKRGFGLGRLMKPGNDEKKSSQVTGSGGARGVDPERDAKGGPVSTVVPVSLTASDVANFKAEGKLN
jgi:predicted Zn-dependent protease